jgi:hypothetical protein
MAKQVPVYTFDDMIASLRLAMKGFPDTRTGKNTRYEVADAASSAFSVFFTQCASLLSFQKLMEQKYGSSVNRRIRLCLLTVSSAYKIVSYSS